MCAFFSLSIPQLSVSIKLGDMIHPYSIDMPIFISLIEDKKASLFNYQEFNM